MTASALIIFALEPNRLLASLCEKLSAVKGVTERRAFPDGESYLRIETSVKDCNCIILADLSDPDKKYLPLVFLAATLRELGALSVGLIAPYLSYMRQDRRFVDGEAVTSRIFAAQLSGLVDWLVTVDPHLHRYHSLNEIYTIPNRVIQGASLLADFLLTQRLEHHQKLFLVGPDAESEQWVAQIAAHSGHSFVVGNKERFGDRDVKVTLPDLTRFSGFTAVIIDDVISTGQTILKCIDALRASHITQITCMAVHGIFADKVDKKLLATGLVNLVTTNTIPHSSNAIDVVELLVNPVQECVRLVNTVPHKL